MVPGAVPDLDPGTVALLTGKGVEREGAVPDDGPVPPAVEVVKTVPVTVADVWFAETVVVNNKELVELLVLVTLKTLVLTVTVPLIMKLVVGVPMIASTLDVSQTGCLLVELGGIKKLELVASVADVVPATEDGGTEVAAEVDPTPVDV